MFLDWVDLEVNRLFSHLRLESCQRVIVVEECSYKSDITCCNDNMRGLVLSSAAGEAELAAGPGRALASANIGSDYVYTV